MRRERCVPKLQLIGAGRKWWYGIGGGFVFLIILATVSAGPIMSQVEQPEYSVISSAGPIEIRAYGAMIAAEAIVQGDRKPAINEGFRLIAAYIFGANKPNEKIAMTAPVQQQGKAKIAMTAPVTQQDARGAWTVRFIMPRRWSLDTLPQPDDPRVQLVPVAARRMLVIRFSGLATDARILVKTDEVRKYAAAHGLETRGEPVLAFYNPPWTLPFLRRNEIMLELANS
jgi:hypothetical protein